MSVLTLKEKYNILCLFLWFASVFRILFVRFIHMYVAHGFSLLLSIWLHKYTTIYLFTPFLNDSHVVSIYIYIYIMMFKGKIFSRV